MDADILKIFSDTPQKALIGHTTNSHAKPLIRWLEKNGLEIARSSRTYRVDNAKDGNLLSAEDIVLLQHMNQPVEATLRDTGVVYLNATNYREEVMEAQQPAMVLFYAKNGEMGRGLAALSKALLKVFPLFKICAYPLPDAKLLTVDSFKVYNTRFGLRGVPTLLLYDYEEGEMIVQGTVHGGYSELATLKYQLARLPKIIKRRIMD